MNCSNFSGTVQENLNVLQLIIYIPIVFFGVIFNVIAFLVFCCKLKKWTETRVYMINLVIADCFLLFTLPFIVYFHRTGHPVDVLCYVIQIIYFTNMPVSIYIITLIAVERYIAIKYPLKAKSFRSPLKAAVSCGFLWIIIIIYAYFNPRFTEEKEKKCFQKTSETTITTLLSGIFGFFIPLVILSFCSIQVIQCLKLKKNMSPLEETSIRKALWIVSMNLCVFIICFLPLNVGLLVRYAMDAAGAACSLRHNASLFIRVTAGVANFNCCLDTLCYYFVAKEFQEASSLLPPFKSLKSRSNQSQITTTNALRDCKKMHDPGVDPQLV
ncbi:G-protein coupled receptor 35-like [Dermochelys coriacea]|uniref:G-protein coupled receptor 35-like n=1 Tax=Dermochelys coriacea TaxID=27794 RepID=UPI0018E8ADDC|nr:G-protein coupled receptor 35-like [Dermochelys coriacea]XP_043348413.1 G-protein coupled receptor 35-like [Dermochelys coriacea]